MTNAKIYQGFHDDKKVEQHCSKLTWTSHLENLGKKVASGASVLSKFQPFGDVHLLRTVYFYLVYSHLNYGLLNWATANWSSIADVVKLNNRDIRSLLKVIVESVFHLEIYFIQNGYYRSRIFIIMN